MTDKPEPEFINVVLNKKLKPIAVFNNREQAEEFKKAPTYCGRWPML